VTEPSELITPQGRRIAYHKLPGAGPGIVFLGGYRSDMTGTKAVYLQNWARAAGRAFVRFDYSGHGQSGGVFEEGCIGDWAADARAVLEGLTEGPQILVGSSMGGWIALLLARDLPDCVAGLIGIAAAPDFTEDLVWDLATPEQQTELMSVGRIELPSTSADTPDVFTRRMIEDGRDQFVLRNALSLTMPVRLLHGTADIDAPFSLGLRLLDHASGADIRLTLVKGADHRFSTPDCLAMVVDAVTDILEVIG
jgi:pimeloyl-ACP methyl ester carboxylesterase